MKLYFIMSLIAFIISMGMFFGGIFLRKKINESLTVLLIISGLFFCLVSLVFMMCIAFFLA